MEDAQKVEQYSEGGAREIWAAMNKKKKRDKINGEHKWMGLNRGRTCKNTVTQFPMSQLRHAKDPVQHDTHAASRRNPRKSS